MTGAVITGLGAVSPIGAGVPDFVAALRAGRSGVRPFRDEPGRTRASVAAPVPPSLFDPESVLSAADVARVPRLVPMALAACREAVAMAGLDGAVAGRPELAARVGLVLGTGAGGIDFTLDQAHTGYARNQRPSLWTITNATHGNLAGELSIALGLRGPSLCVSTGCTSSTDAAGWALQQLRLADAGLGPPLDAVVVVGADAHVRWETLVGMELLRVLNTTDYAAAGGDPASASRPFDRTRAGFVLGEGAWAMVLERPACARERNAPPLGMLRGYAATCDAHHRVRPSPDPADAARAITSALSDAGLGPADVELIHYHGTATVMNDPLETAAVKLAFGEHARSLRGTSVKSMIGHPQGASGLAAAVATLGAMTAPEGAFIPPTINLRDPDIDAGCDLDYTPLEAAPLGPTPPGRARCALINCLAFGAKNAALVIEA